jgi:hypothetical protein
MQNRPPAQVSKLRVSRILCTCILYYVCVSNQRIHFVLKRRFIKQVPTPEERRECRLARYAKIRKANRAKYVEKKRRAGRVSAARVGPDVTNDQGTVEEQLEVENIPPPLDNFAPDTIHQSTVEDFEGENIPPPLDSLVKVRLSMCIIIFMEINSLKCLPFCQMHVRGQGRIYSCIPRIKKMILDAGARYIKFDEWRKGKSRDFCFVTVDRIAAEKLMSGPKDAFFDFHLAYNQEIAEFCRQCAL